MANKYLRSTDGNDADDGSTWALANATMVGLAADMAAGDDGFISNDHAESDASATAMTITFPGTIASPNRIIFGNDAAEPPTTLATTGSLTRTNTGVSAVVLFVGSFVVVGGVFTVAAPSGVAIKFGNADTDVQTYNSATFAVASTSTAVRIQIGSSSVSARNSISLNTCVFKFSHASQGFAVQRGRMTFDGGSLDATGAAITSLFPTALTSGVTRVDIKNFDLSAAASSLNILGAAFGCTGSFNLSRVKLPASWTGDLFSADPTMPDLRVNMYNCDSGDTNYKILCGDRQGKLRDETTLVMSGGASDESTPIAWKVTTTANANAALTPFETDWMSKRNTAVGSAKVITVEILHDSTTDLTDNDIWLEGDVLGTSGVPLGVSVSGKRGVLATSADHTNSAVTWTTTGMTNPNKQYLTISVTPQEVGNILVRVLVAKASYTVYINPDFSIT